MARVLLISLVLWTTVALSPLRGAQYDGIPIETPKEGDRIQIGHWSDRYDTNVVDPLTQIIRITGGSFGGTGFFLSDCRVMTNLHVIATIKTQSPKTWLAFGETLVGEEFTYVTQPIPWRNNGRAWGRFIVLGHGIEASRRATVNPEDDWAIGYDEGCLSERLQLGFFQLAQSEGFLISQQREYFSAGYSAVLVDGFDEDYHPLYTDSVCGIPEAGTPRPRRENAINSDCSVARGGSGQPLLTRDSTRLDGKRNVDAGRPRLIARGMAQSSGPLDSSVPNFRELTTFILFTPAMHTIFSPFLNGSINIETLRHGAAARSGEPANQNGKTDAELVLTLYPTYTEEALRRRVEGHVEVELVVRPDGSVSNLSLVKGIGAGLDERFLNAVSEWRFMPATMNGRPITANKTAMWDFKLPR
jgi:TonB family protein